MAFPKGQKLWQLRRRHGNTPTYATPEDLWDACVKYFEWVEENPLFEYKVTQYQGVPVDMQLPKMRAMTLAALWVHIGISKDTWYNYKKRGDDFLEVMEIIESIVYDQKFSGAAADLLNANIIARDLGLRDKDKIDDEEPKPLTINYTVVDARKPDAES